MQKLWVKQILVAVGIAVLFATLFTVLQAEPVYRKTLARLSPNYERTGLKRESRIREVYKPYVSINSENIDHWDAALYKRIRNEGYSRSDRLAKEKLAFYPLYPFLWRLSCIDSPLIVMVNYALFVAGLLLLSLSLLRGPDKPVLVWAIALLFPAAASFYLPYAESLFLFTLALAVWGISRSRYGLYVTGTLLFGMTRPSSLIFVLALISTELIYFFRHRSWSHLIRETVLKAWPPLAGFLLVSLIQYLPSGSWSAYFDSMELWPTESGFFNLITDWSLEGFGMSVFALFFLAIPALVYVLYWAVRSIRKADGQRLSGLFGGDPAASREYLFHVSLLFMAGNLIYTALTSGNVINGFSRYTMAVPFFYILLFLLPEQLEKLKGRSILLAFIACTAGLVLFLNLVIYGSGHRFAFSAMGLFLSMALAALFLFNRFLSPKISWTLLIILSIPAVLWHTYLFNMFLSDAWIFT